ncbi:MAG: ribulose-phosphate 3-epimerase [Sphaerochaetaceae bacterium]|jgi:ribulose-phosphate 3-epimerase
MKICASLLAANHAFIGQSLEECEKAGINIFHFDVSDGHYTKYIMFGPQIINDLRSVSQAYFDVHLYNHNVESILETFLETSANRISLQYATGKDNLDYYINMVRSNKTDVSVTFTPTEDYQLIIKQVEKLDAVNLLAVNPGIGGQVMQLEVLKKVEKVASYIANNNLKTIVSVDGGVSTETIKWVKDAGADIAIAGSAIFQGSIKENIKILKKIIE